MLILFYPSKVAELCKNYRKGVDYDETEVVTTIGKDLLQTTFLLMALHAGGCHVIGLVMGIFQTISSNP